MLQFSANLSLLFAEYPWSERFKAAKQQGFKAVEIQFPYHLPAELIHSCLQENQLKLVLFNVAADNLLDGGEGLAAVPEKQAEFKAAVAQALEYAKLLEPHAINILPGRCLNPARQAEYLATFKQNLQYAAEQFAGLGITTVFEAINTHDMPGFLIHSSQQMLEVLAEVKAANLALQYDIYHMTQMGEDCLAFIRQHADKIGHIQFADSPGRGAPGSGGIDFAGLFEGIEASAYWGWVGAEYRPGVDTAVGLVWFGGYVE